MRRPRVIPLLIASVLAAGSPPPSAAASPARHHLEQVIVCEYVVKGVGTRTYEHPQFDTTEPSTELPGGTAVWADRRSAVNRRYPNEPLAVRELAGSGGRWVMAVTLARTPAKCFPL